MSRGTPSSTLTSVFLLAILASWVSTPAGAAEAARDEAVGGWLDTTDKALNAAIDEAFEGLKRTGPDVEKEYEARIEGLLDRVAADPALSPSEDVLQALLGQRDNTLPAAESKAQDALNAKVAGLPSLLARTLGAEATNPRRVGLVERSGIIDFVGLAVQGTNFLSADENAVTLNLNAAALLKPAAAGAADVLTYQRRGFLNQLGGSVTFGAKVPEKEITGFSGVPDFDKFNDVLVWNVKVRVGDRDPRAARWNTLLRRHLALHPRVLALAATRNLVDGEMVRRVGARVLETRADAVKDRLARSLQMTLVFSGQHLANEIGKDKYSLSLLADMGLGGVDLTLNTTYSMVQDVPTGTASAVDVKTFKIAGGLSGSILAGALSSDLGTEVTLSAEGTFPTNESGVPARKNVFKADLAFVFPATDTVRVPVSVTWSNDPNNLSKKQYARGQIGIAYDFGSLKKLLKGGS